jgi:Recombination endonuclease VII
MPAKKKINPVCLGCGIPRRVGPLFYLDENGTPRPRCKTCTAQQAREWTKAHPEQYRAIYRRANHRINLARRFGITVEQFNALVEQSDGLCGICRRPETREDRSRLSLDHDHKTGEIRGFLCSRCNLLLGNAGDGVEWLKRAARYLMSEARPLRTSEQVAPVPMILYCPVCAHQHVDEGPWALRIHRSHACQKCGMVGRPALVATVGVRFLPGFKDEP